MPEDDMKVVKRIVCVKLNDDVHNPGEMNGQIMALREHVKARYRLSDLIRAQKNDKMTSNLSKCDELKLGNKNLKVYQMLVQHVARDNSGLSLARRKDATCFLRWIMSLMNNSTVQACHQKGMGKQNHGEKRIHRHTERVPEYGDREGG